MARKPALGSGARFTALARQVGSPALAAWIGRNQYGDEGFSRLSQAGKARST